MDSLLSFPVGLFHPLQHAGLSRRTLVVPAVAVRDTKPMTIAEGLAARILARSHPADPGVRGVS